MPSSREAGRDWRDGLRAEYQEQDQPGQIYSGVSDLMSRGYRSVILAAVGWLALTGQNHSASNSPKQGDTAIIRDRRSDAEVAANTIAAAIGNTVQPISKDEGCPDRGDKRESDLCAQWKAADAAKQAADYALWGLGISILGTGLLLLTFRETWLTSRRQMRAYISIKPLGLRIADGGNSKTLSAGIIIKNGGQTPAYNVVWSGNIVALADEIAPMFFDVSNDAPDPTRDPRPTLVHAGEQITTSLDAVDPISVGEWDAVLNGNKHLYLYGIGEYQDVFNRRHTTHFCFIVEHECLRDGHLDLMAKGGKQAPLVWEQAPYFNSFT